MKHFTIILVLAFIYQTAVQASNSPLKDAIVKGDLPVVQQHLSRSNMNQALDNNGLTPLHLAALYGHKAIVKKLLSLGANVNAKMCSVPCRYIRPQAMAMCPYYAYLKNMVPS